MLILQWWDIPQPTFGFESQFHIIYWICSFCIYAVFTVDICNFLQWIWIFFFMSKIKQFPSCYIVPTFQLSGRTAVKTAYPPEKVAYICYEKLHIHLNSNITITRTQTEAENTRCCGRSNPFCNDWNVMLTLLPTERIRVKFQKKISYFNRPQFGLCLLMEKHLRVLLI